MTGESIRLIDILGYKFYQVSFTLAILCSCIVFWNYVLYTLTSLSLVYLAKRLWNNFRETTVDTKGRGVFITGCDSGFGYAFARELDDLGYTVFAGCLDDKGQGAKKLRTAGSRSIHVVSLDVTKEQSVEAAAQYVRKNTPKKGLWGVVNNAGMNMTGEVEVIPISIFEKGFNVNLYGAIRVTTHLLPLLRQSKGRVVNITSVHGTTGMNGQCVYEVSKHGLETVSDSLRMEMRRFGVLVAVVEPGMFGNMTSVSSDANQRRLQQDIEEMWSVATAGIKTGYTLEYLRSRVVGPKGIGWTSGGSSVQPVVDAVVHALSSDRPQTRYRVPGKGNIIRFIDDFWVISVIQNTLPTWISDAVTARWRGID